MSRSLPRLLLHIIEGSRRASSEEIFHHTGRFVCNYVAQNNIIHQIILRCKALSMQSTVILHYLNYLGNKFFSLYSWFILLLCTYYILAFEIPIFPYGVTDEEGQFFWSALLVSQGDDPFFFRQPAFFVSTIGGLIGKFTGISLTNSQAFLNVARALSCLMLFGSIIIFYKCFRESLGEKFCFACICLYISWPSTIHWANHFCVSSFLAPAGMILFTILWKTTTSQSVSYTHAASLGVISGALVAAKISCLYIIVFAIAGFILIVLMRNSRSSVMALTLTTLVSSFLAYFILSIPYLQYSLDPLFSIVRGLAVGSSFLKGGGLLMYLNHHLTAVYLIVLVIGVAVLISLNFLIRSFSRLISNQITSTDRTIVSQSFIILCMACSIPFLFIGSGATEHVVAGARWSLPTAPLAAFSLAFVLTKYYQLSLRYQTGIVITIFLSCSISVAFSYHTSHIKLKAELIANNNEVASILRQTVGSNDSLGLWRAGLSPMSNYWLTGNYLYAGGHFASDLAKIYPNERLFIPYALPTAQKFSEDTYESSVSRYKSIACGGQKSQIESRSSPFVSFMIFVADSILGSRCVNFIDFLLRSNFETRYPIQNGDYALRYKSHLIAEPGFSPNYLIIPDDVDNDGSDNLLKSVESHYPNISWSIHNLTSKQNSILRIGKLFVTD